MNFNFGEVLTRAWEIVWKHRVLWIFGILASCGRGGGGGNGGGGGQGGVSGTGPDLPPQVMQWLEWIEQNVVTFVILISIFALVIWLIAIAIGAIGKIGLIRGTAQVEDGAQSLIFGQLFSEGMPYFRRVFGLSVLLILPAFLLGLIIAVLVVMGFVTSQGDSAALGFAAIAPVAVCCACLFIPVMIVLNMIFRQAERSVVLEDLGLMPALARGWEVFRANLGPIILMAIILGILGLVVGLVFALPVFIIVFPAAFAYAIGNAENNTPLILAGVCFCLYLPILLLLNGILVAYVESAWTLTYMRLTGKPDAIDQPKPDTIPPAEPDSNKTFIASEPKDSERTVIAKKPDA
ncbi:MAG TPA: hypothetical protein VFR47_25805 [Anaerolineales bacterium]|nr:hypothetical protein [Anaerolineales bacterium]